MPIGTPLLEVFDRMAIGGVLLSAEGQVVAINGSARRTVQDHFNISDPGTQLFDELRRDFIVHLIRRCRGRVRRDGSEWIVIDRENKRPLILTTVALPVLSPQAPQCVLMLLDLETAPEGDSFALRQIFGLSPAEARLALSLGSGETLAEAAEAYGVSVATARAQLKAIFQKTGVRRQAGLVLLISRLCVLSRADVAPIKRAVRPHSIPTLHGAYTSLI